MSSSTTESMRAAYRAISGAGEITTSDLAHRMAVKPAVALDRAKRLQALNLVTASKTGNTPTWTAPKTDPASTIEVDAVFDKALGIETPAGPSAEDVQAACEQLTRELSSPEFAAALDKVDAIVADEPAVDPTSDKAIADYVLDGTTGDAAADAAINAAIPDLDLAARHAVAAQRERTAATTAAKEKKSGGRRATRSAAPAAPAQPTSNERNSVLQGQAAELWNDKTWSPDTLTDAKARRKAIAAKLNAKGHVMGMLRSAGIDATKPVKPA